MAVNVAYAGICGSDIPKLLRPKDFTLPEPWRPGHEIVGTDTDGRWVAIDPLVPCEACPHCSVGRTHLCSNLQRLGWDLPGGFAEQVLAPAPNLHLLANGLDPLHAVLADPAAVAIHSLRCNPVTAPGRLAVIGAGSIGLLTAIYAHQQGWTVTVIHRRAPSDKVIRDLPAAFRSSTSVAPNDTFDVVVDAATGADPAPLEMALTLVTDGGTVVVSNAYHPNVTLRTPLRDVFRRSIHLTGAFSHCRQHAETDFQEALTLLQQHSRNISHIVALAGKLDSLPAILTYRTSDARQVLAVSPHGKIQA